MYTELPEKIEYFVRGREFTPDTTGMSGSSVLLYDDAVLKITDVCSNTETEVKMMEWLCGKIPVPEIICHELHDGKSYLLMSRIQGKMSCDRYYTDRPQELVSLLAEALNMLWSTDISDCPVTQSLDRELAEAGENVRNGRVDISRTEPDTFGENGFESPAALLEWLENNKPPCEAVLSHGDFCLPNIFFLDGKISGYIDLGGAGIGDRWRDISLCRRSLEYNLRIHGSSYDPDGLFGALGIKPDRERLRYWLLLDELF